MRAVVTVPAFLCSLFPTFVLFMFVCVDGLDTSFRLCEMCYGTVQRDSPVWAFCFRGGVISGRCCIKSNSSKIAGLDLSNCSISHVEHLYDASTAVIIDLSSNPISSLTDTVFQGFSSLTQLILPSQLECPGGNASWESSEVKHNARICEGQRDVCNQTMKIAWNCPENSFCRPYGPGFFECSCLGDFHGYKCLRQGEFPILEVLGILSASTAVLSSLLWFTQRRRVRSV